MQDWSPSLKRYRKNLFLLQTNICSVEGNFWGCFGCRQVQLLHAGLCFTAGSACRKHPQHTAQLKVHPTKAASHGKSCSQELWPSLSHNDVKNPSLLFSLSPLPSKSNPKGCLSAETQPDPVCPKSPCALRQSCCHPGAPSQ